MRRLFGNAIGALSMSSTKSAIGHLLGGAGAVESIFCILAMRDQIVPPTLNLDNPSEGCEGVDLVPHKAKQRPVRAVLNNSFGFGGTNASLIMKARVRQAPAGRLGGARARRASRRLFLVVGAGSEPGPHDVIVKEGSTLGSLLAAAGERRARSRVPRDLLRRWRGCSVRTIRSRPAIPDSEGHGRRRGARPSAARQADPAPDHGHRRNAADHYRGEARRRSLI